MKLTNIASLDPVITSSGRKGLKGASIADKAMWNDMQNDWETFALNSSQALTDVEKEKEDEVDEQPLVEIDADYTGFNKTIQSKSRIGQGFFRNSVLSAYGFKCCITGLSIPKLLVASHIIPWSVGTENRLNPRNGLSLSMLHDKAFDAGIITISDDMTIQVSKKQTPVKDNFFKTTLLNYDGKTIHTPNKFSPQLDFLAYHREHIFESWENIK